MIAIRVEDLKKTYKSGFLKKSKFQALKGVSFEIKEGEIFGFLGPNGAGKTTTILSMLNLIKRDSGKISFFEKEIEKDVEIFKDIGYIPEEPYLYNFLKVREFINLGTKLSGIEDKDIEEKIEKYLKLFDLWEKRENIIKTLSKGQKQRVLLALNFILEPKILILDEPFRGLDPVGIRIVRQEIEALSKKGSTIFLSSHIISEVEALCSKVSIINNGLIVWEGNPKEIPRKEEGFKVLYKSKEGVFSGKILKNQEELLEFLKEINFSGGEIVEVLQETKLEDYFYEKVREN
ncbi:MAG: ABC transporter ATP-binding protein [Thermoanaerobaculia bacterium]